MRCWQLTLTTSYRLTKQRDLTRKEAKVWQGTRASCLLLDNASIHVVDSTLAVFSTATGRKMQSTTVHNLILQKRVSHLFGLMFNGDGWMRSEILYEFWKMLFSFILILASQVVHVGISAAHSFRIQLYLQYCLLASRRRSYIDIHLILDISISISICLAVNSQYYQYQYYYYILLHYYYSTRPRPTVYSAVLGRQQYRRQFLPAMMHSNSSYNYNQLLIVVIVIVIV